MFNALCLMHPGHWIYSKSVILCPISRTHALNVSLTADCFSSFFWACSSSPISLLGCRIVCRSLWELVHPSGCLSVLLWLTLLPLTCHPCFMTACRRWPGMVWDMEYPWAKLDCKIACFLHTRHDNHSFRAPWAIQLHGLALNFFFFL